MKKIIFVILAIVGLLSFSSARYTTPSDSRLGAKAPQLTLFERGDSVVELQSLRGSYVLLTFWSSVDVDSRLANRQYCRGLSGVKGVVCVSMNVDRSEGVYRQTLLVDGLPAAGQYHCSDESVRSKMLRTWRQSEGRLSSLLIDPSGVVVAVNPTLDEVNRL